jgi:hypothetical protein
MYANSKIKFLKSQSSLHHLNIINLCWASSLQFPIKDTVLMEEMEARQEPSEVLPRFILC